MAGNLDWESKTNIQDKSCSIANCGCVQMWEILQQLSMKYISDQKKNKINEYKLEPGYEARARRIAAVYAKLYLEELSGNKNMIGRYHWVGLGVFASKTVAAIFNDFVTQFGFNANEFLKWISSSRYSLDNWGMGVAGVHSFAKGNLWLYMDISVWHFAWNLPNGNFGKCLESRNCSEYIHIEKAFKNLPWQACTAQINNLGATDEIREGFSQHMVAIDAIFSQKNKKQKQKMLEAKTLLMKHLMAIARQEQKNILQPIVWNEQPVIDGAELQRVAGAPKAQLILSSEYNPRMMTQLDSRIHRQTSFEKKIAHLPESPISLPPKGTKPEKLDSRMEWINLAAQKYHRLMLDDDGRAFLEKEIKVISTWIDSKWDDLLFDKMFMKISKDSNDGKGG